MNVHACSFASSGFKRQQALQSAAFSDMGFPSHRIHLHDESILADDFNQNIPQANESNRYGNFSFKPYFIGKVLSSIPDGDILLYLDANDRPCQGINEYINEIFTKKNGLNILAAGTNYPNISHLSWFHRKNLSFELMITSCLICQPEAGALVIRNTQESRSLLRAWFELTLVHALALINRDDLTSRHDQETLYLLSRLNKSIYIESWLYFKLTGKGIRKYINWEEFRSD